MWGHTFLTAYNRPSTLNTPIDLPFTSAIRASRSGISLRCPTRCCKVPPSDPRGGSEPVQFAGVVVKDTPPHLLGHAPERALR